MKFGKKLQHQLDNTIPEWRPNFLCYKQLKKLLKHLWAPVDLSNFSDIDVNTFSAPVVPLDSGIIQERGRKRSSPDIPSLDDHKKRRRVPLDLEDSEDHFPSGDAGRKRNKTDGKFIRLVKFELGKFNAFFLEKEEEFLIRHDVLERRTQAVKKKYLQSGGEFDPWVFVELMRVRKQLVALHGEMVLLVNYSSLNYIGLVKILKKHDKQTGANLRQSILVSVVHQPFFSTTNLKDLVQRCLECEESLRSICASRQMEGDSAQKAPAIDAEESEAIARQVRAALQTIEDMRAS